MDKKKTKNIVTIHPVTRLEGLAKITILLNNAGRVENAYYQVVELRGFERFLQGRPIEEVLRITPRICGVCPTPHHLAPAKAADQIYNVEPPKTGKMLREIMALAHVVHSHILHYYAFALPDLILGEKSKPGTHNILGIAHQFPEVAKKAIRARAYAQEAQAMTGAKATHPVTALPGGISKGITKEDAEKLWKWGKYIVEFGQLGLEVWEQEVRKNKKMMNLINSDAYKMDSYYMSVVDDDNALDFYHSNIVRVVDSNGKEKFKFEAKDYLDYIAEHVEPWTYLKFPFLKKIGWKGLVYGPDSGIYRVNSLARLNVVDNIKTPLANEAMQHMYEVFGGKPAHHTLGFNWARLIEILHCGERMVELAEDKDIYSNDYRIPVEKKNITGEGVGVIEAPRGTLYHHYKTDDEGKVIKANIIVATTNNNGPICISVKQAAEAMVHAGQYNEDDLNKIEMAFRAYDPCLACATHAMYGHMPMVVEIYDENKNKIRELKRLN
ncbi:MAG: Ni/Fe hydrogenase subunit alpha [Candidatus Lokiarchaeota archaeon]|nr:Ni/Fe hydrogenase subunit alpha [Candidatus Lokiarchaeota archaeon]